MSNRNRKGLSVYLDDRESEELAQQYIRALIRDNTLKRQDFCRDSLMYGASNYNKIDKEEA